jgi:hypothetical protein
VSVRRACDVEIVRWWDAGATTVEIARRLGLSRERIRQRLSRNGRTGRQQSVSVSHVELLVAAERTQSQNEMALALGTAKHRVRFAIQRLGLQTEVRALLARNGARMRQTQRRQACHAFAASVRRLAAQLGHTPSVAEMRSGGLSASRLRRLFGSATAVARAAGLAPNQPGRPRHQPRAEAQSSLRGREGRGAARADRGRVRFLAR